MKKFFSRYTAVTLCGIWTLIMAIHAFEERDNLPDPVARLPSIDLKKYTDSIATDDRIIVVYFSPGCDACEHEAGYFVNNQHLLGSYRIYFVSAEPMDELLQFSLKHGIDKVPHFKVLQDQDEGIKKRFHIKQYPTILFFDRGRKLLNKLEGEISFSKIFLLIKR